MKAHSSVLEYQSEIHNYLSGQKLFGVVKATILRGQKIVEDGKFIGDSPIGEWVKRDSKKLSKI
jgi:hypothetical protein